MFVYLLRVKSGCYAFRVQYRGMSFPAVPWSCSCVVYSRDKVMEKDSAGWPSTSTDDNYAFVITFEHYCAIRSDHV